MAVILSIDPSFQACGMVLFSTKSKRVKLGLYKLPSSWTKDFNHTYTAITQVIEGVLEFSKSFDEPLTHILSEVPPPSGQMAPALYALDTLLLDTLSKVDSVSKIFTFQPTFLNHVHGHRGSTGTEHRDLGVLLINELSTRFDVSYRRGSSIKQDEGVAVIFLCRFFVRSFPNDPLSPKLVALARNLASEKEQLFYQKP